jgi:FtsP/CotA-like multicopper oxidase with cupredoxin domain
MHTNTNCVKNPGHTAARFQLLKSVAMVATALASMSAAAGPGIVTLDPASGLTSRTYYANSPAGTLNSGSQSGRALRKFVDPLPTLGAPNAGTSVMSAKYIPVAVPSKWTTPNGTATQDEYYELGVVEYTEQLHSDLANPTKMRGYVQIDQYATHGIAVPSNLATPWVSKKIALMQPDGSPVTTYKADALGNLLKDASGKYISVPVFAVDAPHALGPAVLAHSGVPVRFKVTNLLPVGHAEFGANGQFVARHGDLFLPVDKSLVGSGVAPDGKTYYSENRASVHLHGGDSPWISDGTPYQWFAPAGEADAGNPLTVAAELAKNGGTLPMDHFLKGASAQNVPDMPDAGPGSLTFFYPNNQTARALWYHDHTIGLTRVNVAAGMAAPYLITDATEDALVQGGSINGVAVAPGTLPATMIPLVIQDKTFVPADIALQDANWDTQAWGREGDFWFPHVYESAGTTNLVNNGHTAAAAYIDSVLAGANPTARWDFGPELGLVGNFPPLMTGQYVNPATGQFAASTTPEAFMDTPLVNSTVYPTLDVQPKAYRFRLLNATNDRYLNLSLFEAVDTVTLADGSSATSPGGLTEVAMVPAAVPAGMPTCDATASVNPGSGVPTAMPDANGAAAACWPLSWPQNAVPDGMKLGGVPDPSKAGPKMVQIGNETGWLPNTRHVPAAPALFAGAQTAGDGSVLNNVGTHALYMSPADRTDVVIDFAAYAGKTLILYNDAPAPAPGFDDRYDYFTGNADLSGAGGAESTKPGFGPNTRTIMQIKVAAATSAAPAAAPFNYAALDAALPAAFAARNEAPLVDVASAMRALDVSQGGVRSVGALQAEVLNAGGGVSVAPVSIVDKAIVEEFDPNYGRLNAIFGIVTQAGPRSLAFADRPTEVMRDGETTLWRIAHTGVDSHPVHFHLVNVQVVARVNADGSVEAPAPEELGWKETVKMNPAQDIIVAFRPVKPVLNGFTVPSSKRLLDPSQPVGATAGFTQMDVVTGLPVDPAVNPVANDMADFSWEYVWHCHILGHEENDFMRVVSFIPNETAPNAPTITADAAQGLPVTLSFTDNANNEYAYRIERKTAADTAYTLVDTLIAKTGVGEVTTWVDRQAVGGMAYSYRVSAVGSNTLRDATGLSTGLEEAVASNTADISTAVAAPGAPLLGALTARNATISWSPISNAASYKVEQSTDGVNWTVPSAVISGTLATVNGLTPATAYSLRVTALSGAVVSAPSAPLALQTPAELLAATLGTQSTSLQNGVAQVVLAWADRSTGESGYQVSRAATAGGPFSVLSNTLAPDSQGYTDSTVIAGNSYVYQVAAMDGATLGPVVTGSAITAAIAPAAPAAAPTATLITATTLTLSFAAAANATTYKIEQSADAGTSWQVASAALTLPVVPATSVTAAVSGLLAANNYLFRVSAVNAYATSAASPASLSVHTPATLSAPTMLAPSTTTLGASVAGGAVVNLGWTSTAVGQTGYKVERFAGTATAAARLGATWTVLNAALPASTLVYQDSTAAAGTAYIYRVTATETVGAVTTLGTPATQAVTAAVSVATPGALSAAVAGTGVALSWTDTSNNETAFQVLRTSPGVAYAAPLATVARTATLGTATGAAVSYVDATALAGASYLYKVVAIRTTGVAPDIVTSSSTDSNEVAIAMTLVAPTGLSAVPGVATATATPVTLTFTDTSVGETGFEIQRATTDASGQVLAAMAPLASVARTAAQGTSVNVAVSYSDITALPGFTYSYQVRAVNATASAASAFGASAVASIGIAAPSSLSAALGAATATNQPVTLSWIDNASNETRYSISRTDAATGAVTVLAPVARTVAQGTAVLTPVSFTDTSALVGVRYTYTVVAERLVGVTVYASASLAVDVTTTASTTAASAAPSALTANAGSGVSVALSWLDNSSTETAFTVNRSADNGATWTLLTTLARTGTARTGTGTAVSFTDLTALLGTPYLYRVDAVVPATAPATGVLALPSASVAVQLGLTAPSGVSVTQVATGLQVAWIDNSNNETGFQVVRSDASGAVSISTVASSATQKTAVGGAARSWIDTTAVAGVTYGYVVRAVAYTGTLAAPVVTARSTDSAPAVTAALGVAAPGRPTAAITTATSITVSWTDLSTTETAFTVERLFTPLVAGATAPVWTVVGSVARSAALATAVNGAVSFVDATATQQGAYLYRVSAVNQTGTLTNASSAAVEMASALDFTAPAAPTAVLATPAATLVAGVLTPTLGAVDVAWTDASATETGFRVQYATVAFPATGVAPAGTLTKTLAGAMAGSGGVGGLTLTALVSKTTYYVRVGASNLVGVNYGPAVAVVAP